MAAGADRWETRRMTPIAGPATFAAAPLAAPVTPRADATRSIPASTVLGYSLVVALLLSTQYLAQPFVWRHWPWDEVVFGWLEVLRDRIVVATAIGLAIIGTRRDSVRSLPARTLLLALAILLGASIGEAALLVLGVPGALSNPTTVISHIVRWTIVAGVVAGMWAVWRSASETNAAAQALEIRRIRLERQAAQARLDALRGQIEPHFLFNTLATVRRLQQVEPEQGSNLLAHFVDYLRSAQPSQAGSTLGQEIDLAHAYLRVVAQRMDGRLRIRIDAPDELRHCEFPPLSLATLVENAVKHGIAPSANGGEIAISVRRIGADLEAVVADSGVGFSGTSGTGIGLANIRARLDTLFGSAASLRLSANRPSGMQAVMRMPCQPRAREEAIA